MAKGYHLEMVPNKGGALGKLVKLTLLGVGIYAGYKYLTGEDKYEEFDADKPETTSAGENGQEFGAEEKTADDFAARVLKAAKRIPDALSGK